MKRSIVIFLLGFSICSLTFSGFAQDDETRQATGLPMKIGENSNKDRAPLSGKITLQGSEASAIKPTLFVLVYYSGSLVDKRQVNDTGNYFVPSVPRENTILTVEADGVEVGRVQLPASAMGNIRQDLSINWMQVQNAKNKTGVLSAKNFYQRSEANEKIFENAITASKEKKSDNAITLFKHLLKNDSKDFIAWTELGTLYFKSDKYSDAEEAYNKALEIKPDLIIALVNLGKLYLMEKQPEKAIPVLTKAVEKEPTSADANHYLGESYLQIQKGSKAVVYLNEAIRLAPIEKAEIHLRLATLYNGAGLKNKAVEEYKMFLAKVPNYKEKEKIEKYIKDNSPK